MKKILVTIFVALFTMGVSMAQDLGQATELFNNAGTTLMDGNETVARSFPESHGYGLAARRGGYCNR